MNKKLLFLTLFVGVMSCKNKENVIKTGHEGNTIPEMKLLALDSSTIINANQYAASKPLVLISISTTCPFCKLQTKEIVENIKNLKDVRIVILADQSFADIKSYGTAFNLTNAENVKVAYDYTMSFANYFSPPAVPCIAIFGKDKKLRKVFIGNIKSEKIIETAFN